MSGKPVIAITGDFRPQRKEMVPLSWFNTGCYDSVTAAGGLPVLLPPLAEDHDLNQFLDRVDGLILTGCALDLNPVRLGMDRHPATRSMPARREDFDRRLCKISVDRKLTTLAIGAGMQTLNVVCGGTIFQHVTEDVPRALHHRDPVEKYLRHMLEIVPGTRVDAIYGPGEIRVNSAHHQAVDQVAGRFRVSATGPDGVIEAYESIDPNWYCLGVQWHPENETASALDMQVFENFLAACRPVVEQPAVLPFRQSA